MNPASKPALEFFPLAARRIITRLTEQPVQAPSSPSGQHRAPSRMRHAVRRRSKTSVPSGSLTTLRPAGILVSSREWWPPRKRPLPLPLPPCQALRSPGLLRITTSFPPVLSFFLQPQVNYRRLRNLTLDPREPHRDLSSTPKDSFAGERDSRPITFCQAARGRVSQDAVSRARQRPPVHPSLLLEDGRCNA